MRTYSVRTRTEDARCRHPIEAESLEAAALAFADDWHPGEDEEVTVLVTDCETGREHCFVLDVGTGETRAC